MLICLKEAVPTATPLSSAESVSPQVEKQPEVDGVAEAGAEEQVAKGLQHNAAKRKILIRRREPGAGRGLGQDKDPAYVKGAAPGQKPISAVQKPIAAMFSALMPSTAAAPEQKNIQYDLLLQFGDIEITLLK